MASFSGILEKVMPWVGAAAGIAQGNPMPLLTQVAKQIGGVTGKNVSPTGASISQAVAESMANPDQLAKLKEIDNNFQLAMTQAGFANIEELQKLAVEDRESARNREVSVRDWMPKALGSVVMCLFAFVVVSVLLGRSKVDGAMAGALVGYASAKAEIVLTYYFGSSAGSDRKTELMAAK